MRTDPKLEVCLSHHIYVQSSTVFERSKSVRLLISERTSNKSGFQMVGTSQDHYIYVYYNKFLSIYTMVWLSASFHSNLKTGLEFK